MKPMQAHIDSVRVEKGMLRCLDRAKPWSGVVYRAAEIRFANRDDFITGAGSRNAGGRWNPQECCHAVYTSVSIGTAIQEYLGQFASFDLSGLNKTPMCVAAIEVHFQRALDLADGRIRLALGVSEERMLTDNWVAAQELGVESLTQSIGRIAYELQIEALIVASAVCPREMNLVWFPGNLQPPESWVRIVNRNRLPPRLRL